MDAVLQQLAQQIETVTGHGPATAGAWRHDEARDEDEGPQPVPGVLHEVVLDAPPLGRAATSAPIFAAAMLLDWAARAWGGGEAQLSSAGGVGGRWRVWIGRNVWPYPRVLMRRPLGGGGSGGGGGGRGEVTLLDRSLFVDAGPVDARVWAMELALTCPAVAAVVADGTGLPLAATRRLQLAARRSPALLLLARPAAELDVPSAAGARWRVRPAPSPTTRPRWVVELVRCKGATADRRRRAWLLEWNHETSAVCVPADLGHGSGEATSAGEREGSRWRARQTA